MNIRIRFALRCLIVFFCSEAHAQLCKATISIKDDDTGLALTNALVGMSVDTNIKLGWGWGSGKRQESTQRRKVITAAVGMG